MPDVRPTAGAFARSLRVLALAGVLVAAPAIAPPAAQAQAPADATLCPPPPRRLSFAISAVSPVRKPARRKPAAVRPKAIGAGPMSRSVRPVARPAAGAASVAARPKKRRARPRSVVPVPNVSRPATLAKTTGVCQPWTHELAAPLVGMVATAATPSAQVPLVGAVGSPFPEPVVQDDSSSAGGWWWMIPAGGIAIAGTAASGGGSDGGGVAGVEVGRGSSGTPVVGAPAGVEPPIGGPTDVTPPASGATPGDGTAGSDPSPDGTVFVPLPPIPPVGSTTPPGGSAFTPGGTTDTPSVLTPGGTAPDGGVPGGSVPGGGSPGGTPGTPGGPGGNVPNTDGRPPVATAVVPEPSPLSFVLIGGGMLSLVAWGAARRF